MQTSASAGIAAFSRIQNTHDLGGYHTQDGRVVKKGMLLRSGELSYATKNDLRLLKNTYHIKTVIDLRYATDYKYCPDKRISGAKYVNLPVKYNKAPKAKTAKNRYKRFKKYKRTKLRKKVIPTFTKVKRSYTYALVTSDYSQRQYRKFFDYLLKNDSKGGVLFHCIHGKDRTGVAAFMLLVALGVNEETAYKDYSSTNTWLKKYGRKEYKKGKIGVREKDLRYAISKVKEEYGTLESFLDNAYGLGEKKLKTLREKYTK